jgi:hypothetical protein
MTFHLASSRRGRPAAVLLVAGIACLTGAVAPAVASSPEPGSGLGAFNLSASSPGAQFRFQEPSYCYATSAGTNGCEAIVPEAVATLRNGPIGAAISAVVWPGSLAANAGSLLITAGGSQVPDQARSLNDPVRAEAHTSAGPDTVTYDSIPGTTMKAVAKDDRTEALASLGQGAVTPLGSLGATSGHSTTALTGPSAATASAVTSIQDISLAGGLLHIGALTSQAKAVTDGTRATVTGRTVVTGASINGIAVSIDDHGVSVAGTSLPIGTATAAVNSALQNAGMTIALGEPSGKPDGSSVTYNAGSLVVLWKATSGYTAMVVLGGANVSVASAKALDFSMPSLPFVPGGGTGGLTVPGTVGSGTTGGPAVGGSLSAPAPPLPTETAPQTAGPGAASPVLAAAKLRLPGGLSPWLVALGLAGSGLVMAGLRRLPDSVLATSTALCPLEETA